MANSLVVAFRQLRLNNQTLTTNGIRLQLNADTTIMASETGQFASAASIAGFATSVNLAATGASLQSQLNLFSGTFNASGVNIQGQINALALAGAAYQAQINGLSGNLISSGSYLDGRITTTNTNLATTNTNLAATGLNLQTQINGITGGLTGTYVTRASQQDFNYVLPTGADNYFVPFPLNFASIPSSVQATVEVTGNFIYFAAVRGRTISGYTLLLSDIVQESGVSINTFAAL